MKVMTKSFKLAMPSVEDRLIATRTRVGTYMLRHSLMEGAAPVDAMLMREFRLRNNPTNGTGRKQNT